MCDEIMGIQGTELKEYNFNELQSAGVKPGDIVAFKLRGFNTSWDYVLLRDGIPDKFKAALHCHKDKRNPNSMHLSQIGFYWVGDIDNLQFRLTTYDEKNAFVQACVTALNKPITGQSFWGKDEYSQILHSMLKWGLVSENEVNKLNKKLKKLHGVDLLKTYDKLYKK